MTDPFKLIGEIKKALLILTAVYMDDGSIASERAAAAYDLLEEAKQDLYRVLREKK